MAVARVAFAFAATAAEVKEPKVDILYKAKIETCFLLILFCHLSSSQFISLIQIIIDIRKQSLIVIIAFRFSFDPVKLFDVRVIVGKTLIFANQDIENSQ